MTEKVDSATRGDTLPRPTSTEWKALAPGERIVASARWLAEAKARAYPGEFLSANEQDGLGLLMAALADAGYELAPIERFQWRKRRA